MLCYVFQANEGDLPIVPPRRGQELYMVPQGIRPVVQLTVVEVPCYSWKKISCCFLFREKTVSTKFQGLLSVFCAFIWSQILTWGLRNMKSYQLATVSSPSLIVECGGEIVQTTVIKNFKKNPNFPGSVLLLKVVKAFFKNSINSPKDPRISRACF